MTIREHLVVQTVRELAKDRVLNDPSDDDIVLAVQDMLAPNQSYPLSDQIKQLIIREYDAHTTS